MPADFSLEALQALVQRSVEEQAAIRRENREIRSLLLSMAEQGRRLEQRMGNLERRIDDLKDDLELMLKAELMGRLGHSKPRLRPGSQLWRTVPRDP